MLRGMVEWRFKCGIVGLPQCASRRSSSADATAGASAANYSPFCTIEHNRRRRGVLRLHAWEKSRGRLQIGRDQSGAQTFVDNRGGWCGGGASSRTAKVWAQPAGPRKSGMVDAIAPCCALLRDSDVVQCRRPHRPGWRYAEGNGPIPN